MLGFLIPSRVRALVFVLPISLLGFAALRAEAQDLDLNRLQYGEGMVEDPICIRNQISQHPRNALDEHVIRECSRPISTFTRPLEQEIDALKRQREADLAKHAADMKALREEMSAILAAWLDALPAGVASNQ